MYKRKYINPELDLSEAIVKRSSGGDLTEAKTFVNDWNSKRESQLNENVQSATNLPFLGGLYRNSLKNNVDTVKVTDSNLEQDVLGAYFPLTHKIALNTDSEDTKIHEVAHASKPKAQEAKIRQLKSRQNYLRKGVTPNEYLDSDSEIYARLMTLRKSLNLDPNKHYSISEIRKMIDKHSNYTIGVPSRSKKGGYKITTIDGNGRVKSSIGTNEDLDYSKSEINTIIEDSKSIFDRYTPDFIEGLFNEVADNRSSIPMAALGMSTAS